MVAGALLEGLLAVGRGWRGTSGVCWSNTNIDDAVDDEGWGTIDNEGGIRSAERVDGKGKGRMWLTWMTKMERG
ncbi:hypothetical protein PUNSTDRAFT_48262 [Punctularia strigosozonata HHB-11173 SS5]|uniref:uncharacterized protein n=1 Tax=Punctularia strigosozonata (strain HHB-11173) TaxID=741275 RepID=UPI00044166B5|nr:uncharacterized protein PUNSTDRAFT_48262 [Punctularia strigosozonata HHB-11173 SS5]EIN13195.1 hypothetical protein PUNSTDRAFT_48262 [Punctularia strigosozonata HHB-11173 SS5]